MNEKRVLLIIGGGIAAYKSLELIRDLSRRGISCRCIVTRAGAEFVTTLSVSALSGEKVFTDLFDLNDEAEMGHIELSRSADLVVVCPATADLMAKAASGLANDLASTALLATDKPVLMVPAMNVRMWQHPATQRNLEILRQDGIRVLDPDNGEMACGEFGPGRLPETVKIVDEIASYFGARDAMPGQGSLTGYHALVTAGPTREKLDPVRYLSNHSSGRQGYEIAAALAADGAKVTLVSGPVELDTPNGVDRIMVDSALEMLAACEAAPDVDVFVSVAAVADWRPETVADKKLKLKGDGAGPTQNIVLTQNPDILATIAARESRRPQLVIGFAAETHDVEGLAHDKRRRKKCDWIAANDVSGDIMGGADNQIMLITDAGAEAWARMSKRDVAAKLSQRIGHYFSSKKEV